MIPFIAKSQHPPERILRDAGEARRAVIIDILGFKTEQRDERPKEDIDLVVFRQGVERPPAHETEISVIQYHIHAEATQQPIVATGGVAFEDRIGPPSAPDSIDDVVTQPELLDHCGNHLDVVLQVGIDGN